MPVEPSILPLSLSLGRHLDCWLSTLYRTVNGLRAGYVSGKELTDTMAKKKETEVCLQ